MTSTGHDVNSDALVQSPDPKHPANLICSLCRQFYGHGWVTGTGGGVSIRHDKHIFLAPSGVEKELMQPESIFVMDYASREYIRRPLALKSSACTPLFLAAFTLRGAGCSGMQGRKGVFEISQIEQIKGISRGGTGSTEIAEGGRKLGNLGYFDTMRIPIIENTAHEEDLKESLEKAMLEWPETCAVLVRRHGVYVWGKDVTQAKTQAESLDYLFQLAVEMHKLGLKWT
nr:Methylthioribulose-1-phosphate dehydratase [Rachicladosporium sp. CCFEE 5018]